MRSFSRARPLGGVAAALLAASTASAGVRTYDVDAGASSVRIHVGRAGAFSFAGHRHEVEAPRLSGEVTADPENLSAGAVALTFDATALTVRPEGEPPGDAPKVQEAMLGPKLLEVARYPDVTFRSRRVEGRPAGAGAWELKLEGDMTIREVTRPVTLPLRVEISGDLLTASGETVIRHDDFGMKPISVVGLVKVKNEIGVTYRIVARGR